MSASMRVMNKGMTPFVRDGSLRPPGPGPNGFLKERQMRVFKGALLACAMAVTAAAQSQDPPIGDARLTVHTLLREDIFSGFLDNNMERFARADRNVDALLTQRPDQRANLLAWKAGMNVYRAVQAHEAGKDADFAKLFSEAKDGFAEAGKLSTGDDGVAAITGGTLAQFADRLPQEHRAAAWQQAYQSYSVLWKAQGQQIDK